MIKRKRRYVVWSLLAEARSENPFDYGLRAEDGNPGSYGTSTGICGHWFWFEAHF